MSMLLRVSIGCDQWLVGQACNCSSMQVQKGDAVHKVLLLEGEGAISLSGRALLHATGR